MEKSSKRKTSIYLPDDLFWDFKKAVIERRTTDNQALEDAVRQWISGEPNLKEERSQMPTVPRSLVPVIEWVVDLFSRKGTPEKEALKNSIRVLIARRAIEAKRDN